MSDVNFYAICVIWTLLALTVLFLVRNELVFRMRNRAIDAIYVRDLALIERGKYKGGGFDRYHAQSYDAMIFDLTKWTFKQFYPELVNKA